MKKSMFQKYDVKRLIAVIYDAWVFLMEIKRKYPRNCYLVCVFSVFLLRMDLILAERQRIPRDLSNCGYLGYVSNIHTQTY